MIGDAAHAAQTTAGQGAASALEDAVCVGRLIAAPVTAAGQVTDVLAAFDQARRPRDRKLAKQALMIARFGYEVEGAWRRAVRTRILRFVPAGAAVKAGSGVVRWSPPAARAHVS